MGRRNHRKIKQRKRMVLSHPGSNKGDTGSGKVKETSPNYKPLWWSVHQEALKQASPSARVKTYENMSNVHEDFFQCTLDLHKRIHQRINHI